MRKYLIILFIPVTILITSLFFTAYDFSFYENQFQKNNVYSKLNKEDVNREAKNLINYIKSSEINTNYFNEKELLHMRDVYNLFKIAKIINYIAFILVIISITTFFYQKRYKELKSSLFSGSILTLILILLLSIIFINFSSSFTAFHELLFTNNLWILDPLVDKMIVMFPEEFFYSAAINIIFYSILISGVLMVISKSNKFY